MSVVKYNGVVLPYANIQDFRQEVVMDESNTDWMLTKIAFRCDCVINLNFMGMVAPDLFVPGNPNPPTTQNVAELMTVIRSRLLRQRRPLSVTFEGVELVPQPQRAAVGLVDAANGPQPKYCNCLLLSNTTFLVSFAVEAMYWESIDVHGDQTPSVTALDGNAVLSNRWSETVEINNLGMTKYTREGKFVIRSDNIAGFVADQLTRGMATLATRRGFLRESANYTLSPDGLRMSYRIVEQEQFNQPPSPAFRADGEYTETSTKLGVHRIGDCRVTLWGAKDSNTSLLIKKAVEVCVAKLRAESQRNIPNDPGRAVIVESAMVSHSLYVENRVTARIRMMFVPTSAAITDRSQGLAAFTGLQGNTPEFTTAPLGRTNPNYVPALPPFGTANVFLKAAAYYDPSLTGVTVSDATGQFTNPTLPEVGTLGVTREP